MRILISGVCGLSAAHWARELTARGAHCQWFDNFTSGQQRGDRDALKSRRENFHAGPAGRSDLETVGA